MGILCQDHNQKSVGLPMKLGDATVKLITDKQDARTEFVRNRLNNIDDTNNVTSGWVGASGLTTMRSLWVRRSGDTMTGQLFINGKGDTIQLRVQACASATANLQTWENSSGTVLGAIQARGTYICALGSDSTNLFIGEGAGVVGNSSGANSNIGIGNSTLDALTSGSDNVAIGVDAGSALADGAGNVFVGEDAGKSTKDGSQNTAIGCDALATNVSGQYNVCIGYRSGYLSTGIRNVAVGQGSLQGSGAGSQNTAIGVSAGAAITSGEYNIFLGHYAGSKQTTNSNLLIIDNDVRASTAVELTDAILYGVMAAAPADQTLRVNARLTTMGNRQAVATKTTTYTLTGTDEVIVCNSTTAFTVTLPVASGSGQHYTIKNINTGIITVEGDTSDTIDGELNQSLDRWDSIQLVDYAANAWIIV